MNWKKEAENELRNYRYIVDSITNITDRIKMIDSRMTSLKGASADSTPVNGGGNHHEENLLSCIVEKERLTALLKVNKDRLDLIEKGLKTLTERERTTLQRFYMDDVGYQAAIDRLRYDLGYEEANINRIRSTALYHFTVAMYGLTEF